MLSRYLNAAAASREYAEGENNKNIQSIISVNTNILLRRFRLKFLRIMYSTSCYKERLNFENTLYTGHAKNSILAVLVSLVIVSNSVTLCNLCLTP
jgi:hypothetical protein